MSKKPQILQTRQLAQTRIFTIEQVDLRFSNGVEVEFERLISPLPGAVLVVPLLDDDTVLLTREYSAGVDRYELSFAKGHCEAGEDILESANREMMEEVGYGARQLTLLRTFTLSPAYMNHQTHVVLAEDLYEKRLPGDEPEEIEVRPWSLARLDELLQQEECTEARSIAALYIVRDMIHKRKT